MIQLLDWGNLYIFIGYFEAMEAIGFIVDFGEISKSENKTLLAIKASANRRKMRLRFFIIK